MIFLATVALKTTVGSLEFGDSKDTLGYKMVAKDSSTIAG